MSTGLRAIKTEYKGVTFRSRAEARWAVLFDLVEVNWLYEYEGYDLPSGWYLPDFWLPTLQIFAEVKGVASQFTSDAMDKARHLARLSGRTVMLCSDLFDLPNSLIPAVDAQDELVYVDLMMSHHKGRPWYEVDGDSTLTELFANGIDARQSWQWAAEQAVGYFNHTGRYVP